MKLTDMRRVRYPGSNADSFCVESGPGANLLKKRNEKDLGQTTQSSLQISNSASALTIFFSLASLHSSKADMSFPSVIKGGGGFALS